MIRPTTAASLPQQTLQRTWPTMHLKENTR